MSGRVTHVFVSQCLQLNQVVKAKTDSFDVSFEFCFQVASQFDLLEELAWIVQIS